MTLTRVVQIEVLAEQFFGGGGQHFSESRRRMIHTNIKFVGGDGGNFFEIHGLTFEYLYSQAT